MYDGPTRNRLRSAGIGNVDKSREIDTMFFVVPISENDREFVIVLVNFFVGVDDDR